MLDLNYGSSAYPALYPRALLSDAIYIPSAIIMGISMNGVVVETPGFTNALDWITLGVLISKTVLTAILWFKIYNKWIISILFQRYMLTAVSLMLSWDIIQYLHWLTTIHPVIHWLYGFIAVIMVLLVLMCNIEILKKFTVISEVLNERKIVVLQIAFCIFFAIVIIGQLAFLEYLGVDRDGKNV